MNQEKIKNLIEELVRDTNFHVREFGSSYNADNDTYWFSVYSDDSHFFIGRGGEGLQALNHLARRMVEKVFCAQENTSKIPNIVVDVNDYQKKRIESLHTLAHMMAERARYFKSNIEVEPMSSYERRIIHEHLSNRPDIKTESTGDGRDRRVVIKYIGQNL
ncbi:hypothetical protein A3I25_00420 [Candidatus Nomurabacteria bacterium RIFCSPLOWO2_02_FULL_42_17]|uniref:R3H domain-containing protein n=3 Tax=Patescibacteria group TaxID=1783273 RepID=A0A0G0LAC3_9BACT|nr:MAG: hypothetical protein UT04_C0058G0002 [Candidatus Daviesbacteria bacterium GW2011_GWF2_38_7]KKQ87962.1 MAG: hypothetical protein UT12_C0031G0007 [Candidatus Curtissbacteria bacterium GW2011_GWC2_38_9]OGI81861.1 MAG: hypothetical protein A3B93_02025 [Candidatus Nomurabacteria bacterium RIFCSPHIGHO2_02_FULL_42_24]OGI96209.1 MAG: hypothetical protein A3I25_00420 [Candidatus Nomurabacteria bacterium RIFCSPLOWO2_02_FULL_42_17]